MSEQAEQEFEIAVIGGGGAGTMAFLRSVLNRDNTVLFLGDAQTKRKGRATWVHEVDNIPGMHHIKQPINATHKSTLHWLQEQPGLKEKAHAIKGVVAKIEPLEEGFRLHYTVKNETKSVRSQYVILATGIMDIQPEIQGSIKPILPFANLGHVLYCIRCDGHKTIGHQVSIIGHGDKIVYIGALMKERYGHETIQLLTHGQPAEFSEAADKLAKAYGFQVYEAPIVEILGVPKQGLEGFVLEDGTQIQTTSSIVALGSMIYNQLLKDLDGELAEDGRVVTDTKYETSIPGVFAVGDLVAGTKMQIYTAWEEAVIAAEEINRRLRMQRRLSALAKFEA